MTIYICLKYKPRWHTVRRLDECIYWKLREDGVKIVYGICQEDGCGPVFCSKNEH